MSERWIPGKRYDFYKGKDKAANYQFQKNSELQGAFHVSLYIVMEDGSQIGFKYGANPADETVDAFNLYRLDADGKAIADQGTGRVWLIPIMQELDHVLTVAQEAIDKVENGE